MKLPNRTSEGLITYAIGMEGSMIEKARIIPYVKPKNKHEPLDVLEIGCGNGVVLELLAKTFTQSRIVGLDLNDELLDMAKRRTYPSRNVELVKADALSPNFREESLDAIVLCSVLHEIKSYGGLEDVVKCLENSHQMLKKGGRLIIRDGVKPRNQVVHMEFRNNDVRETFYKFVEDFTPYRINYKELGNKKVEISMIDVNEFLSKKDYKLNWEFEVKEHFGIFNLSEYKQLLEKIGFKVLHIEKYLIPFLECRYRKDVILMNKKGEEVNFPASTAIVVGEKLI
ncbi:MAG: methyltransferase domain-containing protein [Candidatus Parvarchaeota archaeon]|nr:methyltransferase domain-containing protein [Candidatus Jingweiarchaeum tengchongense]MCW1297919.1 methyltransferase domain-containing protein [Candidatus Jingweiarchaeum tengchongense]MCW1304643.1 methyltransferase domain-containing protein [Candidatus Jingweiarchaeum tengchongense]